MGSEWRYVAFREICDHSAFGPRFSSDEYAIDGNVACLRTMDIDNNGTIDFEAMPIARLDLSRLTSHILRRDDLVMTRTGAYLGKVAVFSDFRLPVLPGAFSIRFRLDQSAALPLFVRYFFNGPEGQRAIQSVATGSAQPNINITNLHSLEIPLPPLSHQRAIAHILGSLDDKIELNRRMNETLEGMAQELFKSWFVDFDPVIDNALVAGNPIPEELADRAEVRRAALANGTANREAAKPFPAAFKHTEELGWIPVGWESKTLNDLGEVNRGRSRHRPRHAAHLYGGPHPFVQTGDIKAAKGRITSYTQTYSEAGLHQSRLWPAGTMCITIAANIAETAVLTFPACFPDSVIGFIPDEEKCKVYVAEYNFRILKERLQREATGSVQDNINLETISRTYFVMPPIKPQNEFYKVFNPVNERIIRNERESLTLSALRDTLLPKLISGELRIPDAEKLAEAALA
ncbi:MAG: restriction endonuclease subunit S [Planctomycetota bacterium]|nr:restriction endonuclease subunit S [Planctomycetota bacterium]